MDTPGALFTVGHGARPVETLLAVLREARVTTLVDVRRFPGSHRHPQFGREELAAAARREDVHYEWRGEALGGRRSGRPGSRHTALRNSAFAAYADHMDTSEFRAAVDALVARTGAERPAVMCAETVWWHCHRMLIADAATLRGATVVHLLDLGRRQPHRLTSGVRRDDDGWPTYDGQQPLPGL